MSDLLYILYNTLIYGLFAFVVMNFFAYFKYLNFSLGNFMISGSFLIYSVYNYGFIFQTLILFVLLFGIYVFTNGIILKYFKNIKQRELVGLIFTLGLSVVLENLNKVLFGPNSVNIGNMTLNIYFLITILVIANILVFYFFKFSTLGIILKGIFENDKIIKVLGIPVRKILFVLSIVFFFVLLFCGYLILIGSGLKSGDSMFYTIKGIGIMILVGLSNSEFVFLGSLIYVLIEYILFIKLGLPIAYKETLVLFIILLMLAFKPQGLFSKSSRNI